MTAHARRGPCTACAFNPQLTAHPNIGPNDPWFIADPAKLVQHIRFMTRVLPVPGRGAWNDKNFWRPPVVYDDYTASDWGGNGFDG